MANKQEKKKVPMMPISIEVEVAERLEQLGHMHDTYNTVIKRLLDGNGRPHEKGATGDAEDAAGDRTK